MELNAETIKKALEWCTSGGNCMQCAEDKKNPRLTKEGCMAVQMRNALSLITSQEQRIKKLTEENERLKTRYVSADNLIIAETARKIFDRLEAKLRMCFINGDEENVMLIVGYDDYDAIKKELEVNQDE